MNGYVSGRNDEAYKAKVAAEIARNLRNDRIRILKGMIAEGYTKGTTLGAALQDIENGALPLTQRIGRGFTA